jgi:hypothetical protein
VALCATFAAAAGVSTAAVVGVGVGIGSQTGCAGNCATNCPQTAIYVGNLNGEQLQIDDIAVSGPACPPPEGVYCIGDGPTTNCTHFTVTGRAEGACDVLIVFHDRPAEVVHTRFGPPIQQGCCKGYSIVGDSVFVIPGSSDAGISGIDGPTDAVTVVVDAGASDGDAGDGGADTGTD